MTQDNRPRRIVENEREVVEYTPGDQTSMESAYDLLTSLRRTDSIGPGTYAREVLRLENSGFDIPEEAVEEVRSTEYLINRLKK